MFSLVLKISDATLKPPRKVENKQLNTKTKKIQKNELKAQLATEKQERGNVKKF